MSFTVTKTQAGITNHGKLFGLIDSSSTITTVLESLNADEGSNVIEFIFAGSGPLSGAEDTELDNILSSFSNEEEANSILGVESGVEIIEDATFIGKVATANTWQVKTITGAPPNSTILITIETLESRRGGVREVGSTLNRHYRIYKGSLTLPVKTNDDSEIEIYGSDTSIVSFYCTGIVL